MDKEEDSAFSPQDNHQAEDLSAKMARKSKPIPPPLNLTAMGETETSSSPLKDFAMIATSPRSPLVQKNLPFRKRAHSYSSTQTSSECDSPESPRVPASPIAREPSAAPSPSPCAIKSPLSSPTSHFFNKRFLQEPIKSLLPSPNTSASFFNNECDPIKSPMAGHPFFRPNSDLLSLPMMEKNSIKSPLQTPTRSVFLQNHVDSALFEMDKFPLKSPLNTPTRPGFLAPNDFFAMPEPIGGVKSEPNDQEKGKQDDSSGKTDFLKMQKDLSTKFRSEKENIADIGFQNDSIKQEPMELIDFSADKSNKTEIFDLRSPVVNQVDLSNSIKLEKGEVSVHHPEQVPSLLPLDCHKGNTNNYKSDLNDFSVKKEPSSPLRSDERSQNSCSNELFMSLPYNHFIDNKILENYKLNNKNFLIPQNVGYYCTDLTDSYLSSSSPESFSNSQMQNHSNLSRLTSHELIENNSSVNNRLNVMKSSGTYNKPQTYNKNKNPGVLKRNAADKSDEEGGKKSKKDQEGERAKRPMNAFMLYAKYKRPILIQENPGKDNRAISVLLGVCWREIDANVRADYVRRAAALATEHKRRHPDCWKRRRVRANNNQAPGRSVQPNPVADVSTTS